MAAAFKNLTSGRSSQKSNFSNYSFFRKSVYIGLTGLAAHLVYHQFIDTKVTVISSETEEAQKLIKPIKHYLEAKYVPTLYLPFRFMEIIYGNVIQKEKPRCYTREIHYLKDGENIALGNLIRLGVHKKPSQRNTDSCDHSGVDWRKQWVLHNVY